MSINLFFIYLFLFNSFILFVYIDFCDFAKLFGIQHGFFAILRSYHHGVVFVFKRSKLWNLINMRVCNGIRTTRNQSQKSNATMNASRSSLFIVLYVFCDTIRISTNEEYSLRSVVQFYGLYVTSIACGDKSHDAIT
eukprot:386910_1